MSIAKKVKEIAPSLTLEITAKAKKLKSEGVSVIGFGAGEPDFNTPDYIIDAAKKALDIGFTKYTAASGMAELKDAICIKFLKDNGLEYKPNQIVVSTGAKSSLYHAICAVVDDGDEVIKCLILNTPNNPTGAVYTEKELSDIAKVCEKYGIYVISDEIYEKLVYGGEKHVSIAALSDYMKEHTVVVNGMSKSYSMTGWRIGYLAAPAEIAKGVSSMQSHTTSNACSIAQYASVAALNSPESDKFIAEMQQVFDERRKYMVKTLQETEGVVCIEPKGAFYVFADVSGCYGKSFRGEKITGSLSFADAALKCGIALVPGIAFGDDNCIRLSYAISIEDIKEGLRRLKEFIGELK